MAFKELKKPIKVSKYNKPTPEAIKEMLEAGEDVLGKWDEPLAKDLERNIEVIKAAIGDSSDVKFRRFRIGVEQEIPAAIVYIDGMVDKNLLEISLLKPLMAVQDIHLPTATEEFLEELKQEHLSVLETVDVKSYREAIDGVLGADALLLVDGMPFGIVLGYKSWQHRGISEPSTETLIRGPREGFNEVLKNNIALVRRKVKDPSLKIEMQKVGRRTKTDIAILYIKEIMNPAIIKEVKRRMDLIDTDSIFESGYIEQFIEDNPFSPFPQTQYTERPDKVAAALVEGRVAIMVDGTPFSLLVPAVFAHFMATPEDYYERWILMSVIRFFRTISLFNAILLPSLYVSVVTFHQEMLPTELALAMAGSRAGVPFPAFVEALIMEVTFELLREAGIRLPAPIGQTVGIVGGIIIGQAAVQAGLVSPAMVIIVALTAVGSFAIPSFNTAISLRLLRFPLLFLAAFAGLFGVFFGLILITLHALTLKSFGVPYLAPLAPSHLKGLTDTVIRAPLWTMRFRPFLARTKNPIRQKKKTSYYQLERELEANDEGDAIDDRKR